MRALREQRAAVWRLALPALVLVSAFALVGWGIAAMAAAAGAADAAYATVVWIETEEEDEAEESEDAEEESEDAEADSETTEDDSEEESSGDEAAASLGSSLAGITTIDSAVADAESSTETDADEDAEEETETETETETVDSITDYDPLATKALDVDGNEVNPSQLPDSSFIYDTSIEDLAAADSYYDGQTVQVVGEVVGDKLNADASGTYCWISLSSQSSDSVISVYMNSVAATGIDTYGSYGSTGTILQVRGTFNLSCEDHDGETDLHAAVVTVVSRGETTTEEFDFDDFLPGACAVGAGLFLMLIFYVLRERLR